MVGIKRAMIASCHRRVLLADHTKLGRSATHQVAALTGFDHIIVDEGVTHEERAHLSDAEALLTVARLDFGRETNSRT